MFKRTVLAGNFLPLLVAAVLGSALTIGFVSLWQPASWQQQQHSSNTATTGTSSLPAVLTGFGTSAPVAGVDFTAAAAATTSSVVHIKSIQNAPVAANRSYNGNPFDFFGDDPFSFFFGQPFGGGQGQGQGQGRGKSHEQASSGSGVIITNDGYVVTNNHVIENADKIEVTLYDKRKYAATLVGTDPSTDIALLKIEEKGLPALPLANSDEARVGQWVLAVGNPFDLESTVTAGIVSAKGRNIHILDDKSAIESFIQTDAAVNPGNSGGALVNTEGQLLGINTAIATPTGTYAGYAFAVPANIVKKVVDDILDYGIVQRGFLGVGIKDVDSDLAKKFNLNSTQGVYVDSVFLDGSAYASGVKSGDVITKIDGNVIKAAPDLQEMVGRHRPGDVITITVNRKGAERDLRITLKNKSGNTSVVKKEATQLSEVLGCELQSLDPAESQKMGIKGGVKVSNLNSSGKLARYTEINEGFVITKINDRPVSNVADVETALNNKKGGILIEGIYPGYPNTYYYAIGM